jgi:hypothetical protein
MDSYLNLSQTAEQPPAPVLEINIEGSIEEDDAADATAIVVVFLAGHAPWWRFVL